ncbi:MAG: very short patch repair endonuclease [Gemmataceae bacterium]
MADIFTPAERSRIMAAVRSTDTAPERIVRRLVHRMGLRFRLHRRSLPGTPDLVFPGRARVIFVHGCFWHAHTCGAGRLPSTNRPFWKKKLAANAERDRRSVRKLRRAGWKVLVIWECQTAPRKRVWLTARIAKFFLDS